MKKLYLLALMLLLMFIPSTHAVTTYQLDQPIVELNGYTLREVFQNRNHAMTNLNGMTEISSGIYRRYDVNGVTVDYNANSSEYKINGTVISPISLLMFNVMPNTEYTISYIAVSGTLTGGSFNLFITSPIDIVIQQFQENINKQDTFITTTQTGFRFELQVDRTFDNYTFKLQLEKGSTATPYQKPTNGHYSNVDVGQFGLSPEQIETYYNLYLDAIRYVGVHDPTYTISTEFFLISTFCMYLLIMGVGYFTKNKYFYFAGALLWFVPLTNFSNIFIIVASTIVFTLHLIIIFYSDKDDVFE